MDAAIEFTLSFTGSDTENHQIDFYDVSRALIGFQRSLALTTHLIVNGEIITQAPSLKGARVLAMPAEEGSWKTAAVIVAGMYAATTAPKDTPLGHIVYSAYDYMISESLGFHVDYDKTLGQLYKEYQSQNIDVPVVEQYKLDSLIEKCSTAIEEIHRPIIKTESATDALIYSTMGEHITPISCRINKESFEYLHEEFISPSIEVIEGKVSSYNNNTYKGRIYVANIGRPVPFRLDEQARSNQAIQLIVASLSANAVRGSSAEWETVYCRVLRITSRSGTLKSYVIIEVSHGPLNV